jgi:hypothetical protein
MDFADALTVAISTAVRSIYTTQRIHATRGLPVLPTFSASTLAEVRSRAIAGTLRMTERPSRKNKYKKAER